MDAPKKNTSDKPLQEEQKEEIKEVAPDAKASPGVKSTATTKDSAVTDKPTRRGPSIWIRLLRGLLGILILFGLGAATILMLLYVPARKELDEARRKADALATQASTDLQSANQEIDRLSSLESNNKDLQTRLDKANLSLALLQIRLDITNAQLALANEDSAKAKLALSKTAETIQELESLLPQAQREVIGSLRDRLKLVLAELETNAYAARSDLDVMVNTLLELENALNR